MKVNTKKILVFVTLNLIGWSWFLSFPVFFLKSEGGDFGQLLLSKPYWFFSIAFILMYYLNVQILIPQLFRKKRYIAYIVIVIGLGWLFAFVLKPFDGLMQIDRANTIQHHERDRPPPLDRHFNHPPREPEPRRAPMEKWDLASLYIFLTVVALGSLVRIVQYSIHLERKMALVVQDKTSAELAFLKAQANPHFLFNTLNNIYSMATINHLGTADSIYKLSQLMRYFMRDGQNETVSLRDEVVAIKDYIALQKLRIDDRCEIIERYEGLDIVKHVVPFLFMPFVENAFKYGVSSTGSSYLHFEIIVIEPIILFKVVNSVHKKAVRQPSSGLGIKNARRLLEHVYPDRFELVIHDDEHQFTVTLKLTV